MLVRIGAALIDAWLGLLRLLAAATSRLAMLWVGLPGDALARLVLNACGAGSSGRRLQVEGLGDVVVVEDPRLARYLDAMPIRPFAQTVGRYVLCRVPLPEATLRHELGHVRQWARLGPFFLPAYLAASTVAWLRGGHPYRDNRLERAARALE